MTSSHTALRRIIYLLAGWGAIGAAYTVGARYAGPAAQVRALPLDLAIAYHPCALYPYLSFFLLVPVAYACAPAVRLAWLTMAMQACAWIAVATFIAWPTTVGPPPGAATAGLRWLAGMDSSANCLPSLHGALSVLCAWALLQGHRPLRSALVIGWALAVCWSALSLRRHLAIDLFAGVALGLICGTLLLPARRWRRAW